MNTATLTSALQDTFHRIETLGSGNFGGGGAAGGKPANIPQAPSSRVTDSVFGNPMHDIHKIRVPQVIHEDSVLSKDSNSANGSSSTGKRRRYIFGIIVILALLLGIFGAIFFIRRRNSKRLQEEAELAALAEEQFKQQVLEHAQAQAQVQKAQPAQPVVAVQTAAIPTALGQQRAQAQEQARIRAQAEEQEQIQAQEQARARALLRAQEQARAREEAEALAQAQAQAKLRQEQARAMPSPSPAVSRITNLQPVQRTQPSEPQPISQSPPPQAVDSADTPDAEDAADDMEALVAKKMDTRKRLETLRQQLENGITNAVHNVSDSVAKTIAAQRAFSAHTVDQEYDENVLLETGKPVAAPALQDKELPSISLLDVPIAAHPDNSVPIGSN